MEENNQSEKRSKQPDININEIKESVRTELKTMLNKRFEEIKKVRDSTDNVWVRYDLTVTLNEIKEIYSLI